MNYMGSVAMATKAHTLSDSKPTIALEISLKMADADAVLMVGSLDYLANPPR